MSLSFLCMDIQKMCIRDRPYTADDGRCVLTLEPGAAFGTGQHETTLSLIHISCIRHSLNTKPAPKQGAGFLIWPQPYIEIKHTGGFCRAATAAHTHFETKTGGKHKIYCDIFVFLSKMMTFGKIMLLCMGKTL